ncbi:MAG: acyltransferase [Kofleriaceae bacterium]
MSEPSGRPAARHNSPNLDILRAIAVVTVVVDHLIPTLRFRGHEVPHRLQELTLHIGQAGVLAFFVHTSLVLMYSLERLTAPRRWSIVWRFYVRRALRIYPLAVVCVLGVVALGWPEASWKAYHAPTTQEIVANLLLVQNLWTGHSVLTPLWSLPYEVEMYLVLPLLYAVVRRRHGLAVILAGIAGATVGGYALRKLEHGHMNLAAYVPCFLAGIACYRLRDRWQPWAPGWLWPAAVVGLVGGYCWIHADSEPLIYWYGWVLCMALALLIPLFRDCEVRWLNRAAAQVATYSYGVYLLHVPALHIVFALWRPGPLGLEVAAFAGLTAVFAVAAYHLIEAPMVRLGRRLTD